MKQVIIGVDDGGLYRRAGHHGQTHALIGGLAVGEYEPGSQAQQVLELSVAHAKSREQFGRPIGSFQAIAHKCADMFVQVESARSAAS